MENIWRNGNSIKMAINHKILLSFHLLPLNGNKNEIYKFTQFPNKILIIGKQNDFEQI